jgi:hypothetical protein
MRGSGEGSQSALLLESGNPTVTYDSGHSRWLDRGSGGRFIATILKRCSLGLSLDGDFYVRTLFEAYFLALVIRQGVVDAYFSIQMIPAFNGYLCLFGHAWEWGLDDFFYRSRQDGTWILAHLGLTSGVAATLSLAGILALRRNSLYCRSQHRLLDYSVPRGLLMQLFMIQAR